MHLFQALKCLFEYKGLRVLCACRPLAYSTLADLVHHVRQNLSLADLALAVNLFSKNVHDESLPSSIQTMSCKLLLNLVECIRSKSDAESGNVRGNIPFISFADMVNGMIKITLAKSFSMRHRTTEEKTAGNQSL